MDKSPQAPEPILLKPEDVWLTSLQFPTRWHCLKYVVPTLDITVRVCYDKTRNGIVKINAILVYFDASGSCNSLDFALGAQPVGVTATASRSWNIKVQSCQLSLRSNDQFFGVGYSNRMQRSGSASVWLWPVLHRNIGDLWNLQLPRVSASRKPAPEHLLQVFFEILILIIDL